MKRYLFCLLAGVVIISACHSDTTKEKAPLASSAIEPGLAGDEGEFKKQPTTDTAGAPSPMPPVVVNKGGTVEHIDWDKKIIKTAEVSLELKDYKSFNTTIHTGLKAYGAYIAEEKQTQSDYKTENSIVIKVPVDQFDNLLNSIQGDGIKVLARNVSSEDVTGEVVDTKSRLEAKKQVREKYLGLLKQAKNMEEILQVQGEINEIQEQIEAADGRINYLQHSAAYSTVNLSYYQYLTADGGNTDHPDFLTRLAKAFKAGGSIVLNGLLVVVTLWPLILVGFTVFFIVRRFRVKKA